MYNVAFKFTSMVLPTGALATRIIAKLRATWLIWSPESVSLLPALAEATPRVVYRDDDSGLGEQALLDSATTRSYGHKTRQASTTYYNTKAETIDEGQPKSQNSDQACDGMKTRTTPSGDEQRKKREKKKER